MFFWLLGCVPAPVSLDPATPGCDPEPDLQQVLSVITAYEDVQDALADGYTPNSLCEADADGAAMGIHYTRVPDSLDQQLDLLAPDILLYLPDETGAETLIGVEYVVPALLDGELTFDPPPEGIWADAPQMFCRVFDGPMEGHTPGQPWHYDLHVWPHGDNPDGIFAQYNPAHRCPEP